MSDVPEDERLLPLAQQIAEGLPVDRATEAAHADDDASRAVVDALLDIAAIQAAHREAEQSYEHQEPSASPSQWGHLTILEPIGTGQFGTVYRAHDGTLQIDVALKLATAGASASLDASRMLEEARLLAKVHHPNVVRVYGADRRAGRVGMWMDLVRGNTLEQLTQRSRFSAAESVVIGIELCRALAAIHAVGVLHGDLKAHNVIRQEGGRIVLVDFGSGRALAETPRSGQDLAGTPVYLAPEVLGGQPRSQASDIYSLGVLLFHLVTGDYPVYASTQIGFLEAHENGTRKHLRDLRPDLSDGFIQVVERALTRDPQRRYPTAGAMESALVGLTLPSPDPNVPDDRRSWRGVIVGLGTAAIVSAGAAAYWLNQNAASRSMPDAPPTRATTSPLTKPAGSFDIEAAFYRVNSSTGSEERLTGGSRLKVNDQLHLTVQTTAPTYLYVVNEDERGAALLLFPLRDQASANPLPPDTLVRVPEGVNWRVDAVGGREHFLVFASTDRLMAFEDAFKKLQVPTLEGQEAGLLPADTLLNLERLRSVGGLSRATNSGASTRYRDLYPTPLAGRETAEGMWVRRLTLTNDGR